MNIHFITLRDTLNQEINIHERLPEFGGLNGMSGRPPEWEKGFCQAMRHIRDNILPALVEHKNSDVEVINASEMSVAKLTEYLRAIKETDAGRTSITTLATSALDGQEMKKSND